MSFLVALWLTGWRVVLANLYWPAATVLYIVLLWRFVRWYRRRQASWQQAEQEPVEFTEEELQRLAELRRRYVAQEVQP